MPSRRRYKGKVRGKHNRCKDASSEDMDSQPLDQSQRERDQLSAITDQLAKKRLVKSSTDTEVEQQEQKENLRRQHGGDGYDADFETSEFDTTSAGSDMDCQTQPNKAQESRPVLSTSRSSNGRNKDNTPGSLQKKAVLRQGRKATLQDSNNSSLALQSQQNIKLRGRKKGKRKTCSTDSTGQHAVPSNPSALLTSPEMMHLFPPPKGSDSSTPLSEILDSKSEANDSCFGFEGLLSPQQPLLFSPVLPESPTFSVAKTATSPPPSDREDETPPPSPSLSLDLVLRLSPSPEHSQPTSISSSLYSSVASTSGATSRVSHKRRLNVNLTGLIPKDDEQGPPKKAVRRKKPQKKKEEDAWTLKMSTEFDDIEMFELTVE